jgi:sulfide:quinone oxidoreductase
LPAVRRSCRRRPIIVVIGAGAAGTALASRLIERLEGAQITVLDGRAEHFYQPGLSLVAAGLKPAAYTLSRTTDWLPRGVTLIAEPAAAIDPVAKTVATAGGQTLSYDFLVVAPGLALDHEAIEGFSLDLVGKNGIGALYAGPDYASFEDLGGRLEINQGGRCRSLHPPGHRG